MLISSITVDTINKRAEVETQYIGNATLRKRYLAGALNAQTGKSSGVECKMNSEIFVLLMAELRKHYRSAKKITLIADNYIIYKSAMTKCFLDHNDKFKLLFQPGCHPWMRD